jgi:hypothetical protein
MEDDRMGSEPTPNVRNVNLVKISRELDKVTAHLTKLNDTVTRLKGHLAAPAAPAKKSKAR